MRLSAKKLTKMAALTATALIIFIIEAQIPLPIPIPGVKLGLSNAVTLFALFCDFGKTRDQDRLTTANVFLILTCRIILSAAFTGRLVAFFYSLFGGLLSFAAMAVMRRFVTSKQIWVCSAVGAIFHNVGQIFAAILITGTLAIAAYLPILIIAGVITGIITGFIAQFAIERLARRSEKG